MLVVVRVEFNSYQFRWAPEDSEVGCLSSLVLRILLSEKSELLPTEKTVLKLPKMDTGERAPLNNGARTGKQAVTMDAQASMCAHTSFHAEMSVIISNHDTTQNEVYKPPVSVGEILCATTR